MRYLSTSSRPRAGGHGGRALRASLPLAILFFLSASASAADWPMFRGNAARTGYTAEQAAPPLTPAWTFHAGGDILSSPAVFEGVVYFGARDGGVYAVSALTGSRLWRYQASNWVEASPCVSGALVYAASIDGNLYALDRHTGALAWRQPLGSPSVSAPLVSGGKVYAGTGLPEKKLKVFDALTGAPLGSFQAGQPVDSAPAAYGANIYFGANDGMIYAIDRDSLLQPAGWTHYPTAGSFRMNAVAVSSGVIYALPGHDDKKVYSLSAVTGNEIRRSSSVQEGESWQTFTSPVVNGGRVYFAGALGETGTAAAGNNYLSAMLTQDLSSVWASSPSLGGISGMGILSSPAMANDIIYAGTVDGRLVAASSAGISVAALNLSSAAYSSPAVANGGVFIGTMGGDLFAFSAGKTAAISAPEAGLATYGDVTIRGYVVNPYLAGYTVDYSSGGNPEVWHNINSVVTGSPVEGDTLAVWDASVLPNGLYTLKLTVLEQSGAPALDNTALLTIRLNTPPAPLSGLSAADVPNDNGNRISLSWSTAALAGMTGIRIYRQELYGDSGLIASLPGDATGYIDAAAVTGSTFTYTLRVFDGYMESDDSDQASAFSINDTGDNTPPARVSDLAAEPGVAPGIAALVWTGSGNDGVWGSASYYIIKRSTDPGYNWSNFDLASGGTRPVDGPAGIREAEDVSGLFGGVTYYFALKAVDAVGNISQLSNIATGYAAVDLVAPLPPAGLEVLDTPGDNGGRLNLSWALSADDGAGAGDVYGYKIYRRLQNSSYVSSAPYAQVAGGVKAYTDTAAAQNIRFYYSVAAFDSTNNSALSNEAFGVSADNWRFFDAAQGASVRLPDGARVDLPGGSASQNDSLMFIKLDAATYQPLFSVKAAAQANPTDIVYEVKFENAATKLLSHAVISLPYTDGAVVGMSEENLRLYTLSDGAWALLNTSSVDAQAKKVSAEVSHFSIFRIMEYLPSGGLFGADEVYTYPNPARGDTVTFKFRPSDKAFVKVDVYNVAGEQVASLEKANCPAGVTSEIAWTVKNIASGIYIYRVRAESASGNKAIIKKLAVIH